ncbi:MAG: tRNA (guanosine(37)-N1)-methyltransferase TrmD [Myxococcota bacterium]|jgi:tRNA (guanine37-N1)-methyltransferase|nr:tRNA (guanosine(37)-N1)-methyltransferase TrmD [Myxococcota bacterium]
MFRFHVVTLFPELFTSFVEASLIGKARSRGILDLRFIDLRAYAGNKHNKVDDTPFGGGSGMVMMPAPIFDMLDAQPRCHRVLMSPQGKTFTQADAARLVEHGEVLLFCGRYEGVDERVRQEFDEQISLGDFILNGGEVAAMAIIEAVSRLVPGMLGNAESTVEESFSHGLLEYPQYTRPEVIRDRPVPQILLSGDHARIARWRRAQSLLRTRDKRPDLFSAVTLLPKDIKLMDEVETGRFDDTIKRKTKESGKS